MKSPPRETIGRWPLRHGFLLIPLALACFALSPTARAVCQQGCRLTNTFLGEDAFLNDQVGVATTAIGGQALYNNIDDGNTAIGAAVLSSNTTGTVNTAIGDQAMVRNSTGGFN